MALKYTGSSFGGSTGALKSSSSSSEEIRAEARLAIGAVLSLCRPPPSATAWPCPAGDGASQK